MSLPKTLQEQPDITVAIQYFGGRARTKDHPHIVARFVRDVRKHADKNALQAEVLINVDSVSTRRADLDVIEPALGPRGYAVLSHDLGETRAYNGLARLARGRYILFAQDDMMLRARSGAMREAVRLFQSLGSAPRALGLLGFAEGACCVQCDPGAFLHEVRRPRCREPITGTDVEAVVSAGMGPLMVERDFFLQLGGFNETLSHRGEPSTLLDFELSARVWRAGRSVMIAAPLTKTQGRHSHIAWTFPGLEAKDASRCRWVRSAFLGAVGASHPSTAVQQTNGRLDCSGATKDDQFCGLPTECGSKFCQGGCPRRADARGGRAAAEKLRGALTLLDEVRRAAERSGLTSEVLVNHDSRHVGWADALELFNASGSRGAVLLSPNGHELRGYNRLAMLSRATFLFFMQDDDAAPRAAAGATTGAFLSLPIDLLRRRRDVGSVSIKGGLFFVSDHDENKVGVQRLDDLPGREPRCVDRKTGARVEAVRCADVGPLVLRRAQMLRVGGFNESGVAAGEPGSVRVDCELQARMAQRGLASVALGLPAAERWSYGKLHVAWDHPRMDVGHDWRMLDYRIRFERPQSEARLRLERTARAANAKFDCPRARIRARPATLFDCCVVNASGTCLV